MRPLLRGQDRDDPARHLVADGGAHLQGRRAAREGRPWPPALATAPAPKPRPVKLPKGPPRRVHRFAEQQDLEVVRVLLAATWFPSAELDEQLGGGRRLCVVLELGGVIIGAAVLDEHGAPRHARKRRDGAGLRPLGWNERNVESDGGPRTYTASSASIGGRACQIPARTVSFLR
jgi:hypothetical protein